MLNTLKLTNFKRHRDLSIDFTDGINATRGANEAGKSSMLHAIAYALFGSKALPHSLDDTVTWGEDVKTMKVALTMQFGENTFTFTRAKSGAEVVKNGTVFVTGQNEVSAFAANLLGADGNSSTKLMFASQNGLRGALEEGPKALSQMIEDLAGFDAFDTILDAAQEKLSLGSSSLLEERLKNADASLASATETLPVKPDEAAWIKGMEEQTLIITECQAAIPALKVAASTAKEDLAAASTLFLKRAELEATIERAKAQVNQAEAHVAGHAENAGKIVPDLEPLRQAVEEAKNWTERSRAYTNFIRLESGQRYMGTVAQFDRDVDFNTSALQTAAKGLADVETAIAAATGRRINHDNCDKCGQDVAHLETVIKTNAEVDIELAKLAGDKLGFTESIEALTTTRNWLRSVSTLSRALTSSIARVANFVTLDDSIFPPVATWVGTVPSDVGPDLTAASAALSKAEALAKLVEQSQVKLELVESQLADATKALTTAEAELAVFVGPDSNEVMRLDCAKNDAEREITIFEGRIILAERAIKDIDTEFMSTKRLWSMGLARVNDVEKVIAQCKIDIDSLGFNNALVKKLRNIRPAVADKLWNTILASVSVMFSQMRGEESWVTKGKDGFKVNAQSVESLSGSTLDLLGLAIRCALIKTFLPQCGLLILDEPAHGCDVARTEALVGFIAVAGFQQTLLVTHEDVSESVANNIITL